MPWLPALAHVHAHRTASDELALACSCGSDPPEDSAVASSKARARPRAGVAHRPQGMAPGSVLGLRLRDPHTTESWSCSLWRFKLG